jgi:hypothetical protein
MNKEFVEAHQKQMVLDLEVKAIREQKFEVEL